MKGAPGRGQALLLLKGLLRMKIRLGRRTVIAATCRKCGKFKQGREFGFHRRNFRDKWAYIDQRCTKCKWGAKVKAGLVIR